MGFEAGGHLISLCPGKVKTNLSVRLSAIPYCRYFFILKVYMNYWIWVFLWNAF